MNIKEAKNEIRNTLAAYLRKNEKGEYIYPLVRQRPILLMGPPGIGKTAIMEQVAEENQVGLVSYTITHHTRQTALADLEPEARAVLHHLHGVALVERRRRHRPVREQVAAGREAHEAVVAGLRLAARGDGVLL